MAENVRVCRNCLIGVYKNGPIPPLPDFDGAIVNRNALASVYQNDPDVRVSRNALIVDSQSDANTRVDRLAIVGVYLSHQPVLLLNTVVNRVALAGENLITDPAVRVDRVALPSIGEIDPSVKVDRVMIAGEGEIVAKARVDRLCFILLLNKTELIKFHSKRAIRHRWQKR